jgi:hypothetical protein
MTPPRALLLPATLALACAVPVMGADLRPLARNDAPPVAITVSAAAASQDLLRHSDSSADERSTLVLRLHLHNGAPVARSEEPARYRLNVVGADGRRSTGVAMAWGPGELPSAVPGDFAGQTGGVELPPGAAVTIWVAFRGLGDLALSGPARIELELPGERTIVVNAPNTPARWTAWRWPRALVFRAGLSYQGRNHLTELGIQTIVARGPLVFGMTVLDHAELIQEKQVGSYQAAGVGLFAGLLPREWPGVVAGADGMFGFAGPVNGVSRDDLWMLRTYAALRLQLGQTLGVGGGALPISHLRPSPLRSVTFDLGYSYTFTRGAHPDGGGVLFIVGAPLLDF